MAAKYSWVPLVVLVAIVFTGAGIASAVVYVRALPTPNRGPLTVEWGDNVTVNYVGSFGSGPENGTIFDSSLWSVVNNSVKYPKSLEFSNRGRANYTQLGVYVGANAPSSGFTLGNRTFGGVVTGFWKGLIGTTGNVSRRIVIPPSQGYGALDPACLQTSIELTPTIPAVNALTVSQFQSSYPGITAATGATFTDPLYGWTDYVLSANATWVTLQYQPTPGQVVRPYGWNVLVTNISTQSGAAMITLSNELTPNQAGLVLGTLPSTASQVCSSSQFIVSAINPVTGLMTWNFNREVVGQTLVFTITPVDIFPGPHHVY